ncbi:MAG TPA: amidohydrolase family protein, partial [Cellulomonas sp.]
MTSTLYRHGVIHSVADPFAEAILVDGATIAWIGADDTADGLAARADDVVELDGALVAPGFVDAHTHVLATGLALEGIDLSPGGGGGSLADVLAAVHRTAEDARHGPSGALAQSLLGFGWDDHGWPEGRAPSLDDLDRAGGGAPLYLSR